MKKKKPLPKNVDTTGIEIEYIPTGKISSKNPNLKEMWNRPLTAKGRKLHKIKK